jgi:hypothetical protein
VSMRIFAHANRRRSSTEHDCSPRRPANTPRRLASYAAVLGMLVGGQACLAAPALAAAPETPTTEAATLITGTTATLNGTLNPKASATAGYYFAYGRGGTCEGATTEPGAEATGKGIKVSAPLTGLEGNTEYTFCVAATHFENEITETTFGLPLTFTTHPEKPTTEGGEVTALTPFAASVYTLVNPQNEPTTCVFEYGIAPAYGNSVPCEPSPLEGEEQQVAAANFSGLTPAKAYHYRVVATNATGKTTGLEGTFTTLTAEAPVIEGETISQITSSSAKVEAQINPNYQETSYSLEYATDEALTGAKTVPGAAPLPAGFGNQPVSFVLSGLQPRTTYYYRVVATNGTGTTEGAVQPAFTTLAAPIVTTGAAQVVSQTLAEVSGSVNPGGIQTRYHVAYISQEGYEAAGGSGAADPYVGGSVSQETIAGSDYTVHSFQQVQLPELTPGTTYHYAVVASNDEGTTFGPDMTFTTLAPTPPQTVTGEAVGITQVSALLVGAVDTHGLRTTFSFEFGGTPALGYTEPASLSPEPQPEGSTTLVFLTSFSGTLQPGTTYYYRATASNADGVSQGAVRSFTTASFPAPPTLTSPPLLVVPKAGSLVSPEAPVPTKPRGLSKAQKLAKALQACAKKPKSKRAACKKQARKKFKK